MKRKLIVLVALVISMAAILTSCFVVPDPSPNDPTEKGLAYGAIIRSVSNSDDLSSLVDGIYGSFDERLQILGDSGSTAGGEIAVGATSRQVSSEAIAYLEGKLLELDLTNDADRAVGYVIYEKGGDVALYWSDGIVAKDAADAFLSALIASDGTFSEGFVRSEVVSALEYKRDSEEVQRSEMYDKLSAGLGEKTAVALKNLYGIYDADMLDWLAGLYDPGVGGFYYSKSAMANVGFLPDLESTAQALSFIVGSGLIAEYGNDLTAAFPAEFREQLVAFARGCQSSADGYFYHKQWGYNVSNTRRNRDLSWGKSILSDFGEAPLYDTPDGMKGTLGAPSAAVSKLTGRLGGSTVAMVSKVVSVESASALPSFLQSKEDLIEYLDGLDWADPTVGSNKGSSYHAGGEVMSFTSQIKVAGLSDELIEYMDAMQERIQQNRRAANMEPNGLWDPITSIDGTNGLMKIVAGYSSLGAEVKYAKEAIDSIFYIMRLTVADETGDLADRVVDTYNLWFTINELISNIEKYGDSSDAEDYKKYVRDNAPELIGVSMQKIAQMKRTDGSYGMRADGIVTHSLYNTTVAVKGSYEGEINGNGLASTGLTREICQALGVKEFIGVSHIPLFYDSDFDIFLYRLSGLSPVVKEEIILENTIYDFEDEGKDTLAEEIGGFINTKFTDTYAAVTADPEDPSNQVLLFDKSKGASGDKFSIPVYPSDEVTNCFTLSFRLYIDEWREGSYVFQIRLDSCYNFLVRYSGGELAFGDRSSGTSGAIITSVGMPVEQDRWYDIGIEYYPGTADSVEARIFLDGNLVHISRNYYGADSGATPASIYNTATFSSDGAASVKAYFDDIEAGQIQKDRTADPENERKVSDFDSYVGAVGGTVTDAPDEEENKALMLASGETAALRAYISSINYNTYSAGMRLYVPDGADGEVARLYLCLGDRDSAVVAYSIERSAGEVRLRELKKSGAGNTVLEGLPTDEWFELTVEHYRYQFDSEYTYCRGILYVDGAAEAYTDGFYYVGNLANRFCSFVLECVVGELYADDVEAKSLYKTYVNGQNKEIPDPDNPFPRVTPDMESPAGADYSGIENFDGVEIGENIPEGFFASLNNEYGNGVEIVADSDVSHGKVLRFYTDPSVNGGNTLGVEYAAEAGSTVYVFEASFKFSYVGNNDQFLQLFCKDADLGNVFGIRFTHSSGAVYLRELNSSAILCDGLSLNEWIKVRAVLDTASRTVTVTVMNAAGSVLGEAVISDVSSTIPDHFRIFALKGSDIDILIDDVTAVGTVDGE